MPSERQVRWAEFRVLVVTIVAAAILTVFMYLLTGGTLFQAKATLYVYVPDAGGLGPGTPVRVDGIGVGKVSGVKLSRSNQPARTVQLTISVERNHLAAIPVDSTADLGNESMLGDKFIEIKSGSSSVHVSPGGEIPLRSQSSSLDLVQFAAVLRTVDGTLRELEDGATPLGQFVQGDQMYRDLLRRLVQIQRGLRSVGSSTSQIGGLLFTDKTFRQLDAPLVELDQTLARIQSGQGPMGEMLRDSAQYDEWRAAMVDLRRAVAGIRGGPLVQTDSSYRQWNRSLASFLQQVDELNSSPAFSSSEMYDNLTGMASELRSSLQDFQANPHKYMRIKVF